MFYLQNTRTHICANIPILTELNKLFHNMFIYECHGFISFLIKYYTKIQKFLDMSNYFLFIFVTMVLSFLVIFLCNWSISKLIGSHIVILMVL